MNEAVKRHKLMMGSRYIEVFPTSAAEIAYKMEGVIMPGYGRATGGVVALSPQPQTPTQTLRPLHVAEDVAALVAVRRRLATTTTAATAPAPTAATVATAATTAAATTAALRAATTPVPTAATTG